MPTASTLTIVAKDTVELTFTVTTDGTTAVDTSSATCEFRVDSAAGTNLIDLSEGDAQITVGGGGSSNVITVDLGTADTAITAGRHDFSFQLTVSSEIQTFQGAFLVLETRH